MTRVIPVLFAILFVAPLRGQFVELNEDLDLDTLHVWVEYSDSIDNDLKVELQWSVVQAVEHFNTYHDAFAVVLDSTAAEPYIRMTMGEIEYVDTKSNLIWSAVGVATLVGHVYVIGALGYTLPILLIPATHSRVDLELSEGLAISKSKHHRFSINPSGYLRKPAKQRRKMVESTKKTLYRFFKKLDKQDRKNNRR